MITPKILIGRGKNLEPKNEQKTELPTEVSRMHVAISQVSVVEETYQKISDRYNFTDIRTPQQAINCGISLPVRKNTPDGNIVVVNEFHKCKSLALARKANPEQATALVNFMVAKTIKAFNIDNNMDVEQIKEAAQNIMNDFYYMNLGEIYYVLRQAKMGKFGKIYNRIDEAVIYEWFMAYDQERTEIAIDKTLMEHDKVKARETNRQYDNFFDNMLRDKYKEERNNIKEQAYKMAQKMTQSAIENIKLKESINNNIQAQEQNNQNNQTNQPNE